MTFHSNEIDRAIVYIKKLFERGKSIKIEQITQSRSISQNSYCWLVFTHVGQETGYTKDEVYQFCLKKFQFNKVIDINGITEMIPITLSGMTKEQNSQFIDQVVTFFRSEGYEVPDPEDKKTMDMLDYYKNRGIL
jgi:hypothetical protein